MAQEAKTHKDHLRSQQVRDILQLRNKTRVCFQKSGGGTFREQKQDLGNRK